MHVVHYRLVWGLFYWMVTYTMMADVYAHMQAHGCSFHKLMTGPKMRDCHMVYREWLPNQPLHTQWCGVDVDGMGRNFPGCVYLYLI